MSAPCGTYAGAQRHRRRGETVCPECLRAQAAYAKAWRERTGRTESHVLTAMEIGHLSGKLGDFW